MRWVILDLGELPCLVDVSKLNPGPSGEDADAVGPPRDVGSPIPRQAYWIGRHQGPKHFYLPGQAGLSSFGAQVAQLMRGSIMTIRYIRPGIPGELHDPFDRRAFVCAVKGVFR